MNGRVRGVGLVALIAALAGCGPPSPTGSVEADASRTPTATPLAAGLNVWCGEGDVFPPFHLEQTGRADRSGDEAGDALRAYLASPTGGQYGAPSWVRVAQGVDHVQFLGRRPAGSYVFVRFARVAGTWQLDMVGQCAVRLPLEPGTALIDWWLDPTAVGLARPELSVLLHDAPCDPGDSKLEYVLPPVVIEDGATVTVAIFGRDAGVEYCAGPIPMVVELSAPPGERAVFDGGVYPPRRVTTEQP